MHLNRLAQWLRIPAIALFSILLASCGSGDGEDPVVGGADDVLGSGFRLMFEDDFGGPAGASRSAGKAPLTVDNWRVVTGRGPNNDGWGNNEWQTYQNSIDNLYIENGALVIEARCDSAPACNNGDGSVTSARITTKDKLEIKHGGIQARIKVPGQRGMWPAFWMLGSDWPESDWPDVGEIDIMEMLYAISDPRTVHFNLHWAGPNDAPTAAGCSGVPGAADPVNETENCIGASKTFDEKLSDDYHVYEVIWNDRSITGKIDGIIYFNRAINLETMEEFQNKMYLLLNVGVGGAGGDPSNVDWTDPQKIGDRQMKVDWVRVYEAVLPSTATLIAETGRNLDYNRIIQSQEFQGNEVIADLNSTAVPALEGNQVLQVNYTNTANGNPGGPNAGFGGIFFEFNSADATYFTNLVFSIDTSAFPDWDDMTIEVKDTSDTALQVLIKNYKVSDSGNWETYSIPFSDFAGVDISKILFLGFLNPVNEFDQLINGTLYIDDIRLVNQACAPNATVEFDAVNYRPDAVVAQITVNDTCAANSVATVKLETGTEEIVVGVDLDAAGHGESFFSFVSPVSVCPASDEDSTIALSNPLIATYNHTYRGPSGAERIDTATATAGIDPGAIATEFTGEQSYIIAADPNQALAFALDSDFNLSDFSSGSNFDFPVDSDSTFSPVWSVGNSAGSAAVFAMFNFASGFTSGEDSINFKVKDMPGNIVLVKFGDGDPDFSVDLNDSNFSTQIGTTGWYEVSIPMTNFPTPDAYNYLVIKSNTSSPTGFAFLVTDIYLEAPVGSVGAECAAPTTAAPTPTEDPADVISLLNSGNVYTNVVVDTWAQFGNVALLETTLDGSDIKRYSDLGFVGVFTGTTPVDISQMTNLRIDVWSAGVTELEVKLVDFLADSTDGTISEDAVFLPLAQGQWVSLDIPLSDFTLANNTDIQQLIFAATGGSGTIFIGNVYYHAVLDPATGGSVPDATILEADGSTADLTAGFTGFDSQTGTVVVSDSSYTQALEVTVANGYAPTLALAQLFITGLSSLDSYGEFLFKVKGLTDNNLVLKIEPPQNPNVAIDLSTPGSGITVTDLGDGWSQVVVDLTQFGDLSGANVVILQTLDNAYAVGDTFLLTDIGFNNAGPVTATGGSVPDATILEADGSTADLTAGFTGFDSQTGTVIVSDSSYTQALEVTVANGYAPTLALAQLFITGLSSLDSYGEFLFKVKGLTDNNLVLKIEPPQNPNVAIDLSTPGSGITVTDLGDGWSQVVVDLTQFGDLSGANVVILQTLDNAYAVGDTFLLTDIGFNNAGPVTATGGSVPDATILEADGSTADLTAGFTGFDSQTGTVIVSDSSYTQALEVTVANGYAPTLALAQLFITGLSSLDSYGEFLFKVKGLTDNNLVLKIEPPQNPNVAIDLSTPGSGITVTDLGDGWSQVAVDLTQFGDLSGANVVILQTLDNAYAVGDTFLLTDIGFNNPGVSCDPVGGELATNGGLESGDFSCWTLFNVLPTISTDSATGAFAANLVISGPLAQSVLKQERIAMGTVSAGQTLNISFKMKGTAADGGVINPKIIFEDDTLGTTAIELGTIAVPTAGYTTYPYMVTAGNVGDGISMEFAVACGGASSCNANVLIDDVTITIAP